MATNLVYMGTPADNRVETLAATYGSGAPVVSLGGLPAVTLTGSGDYTKSETIAGYGTLSGIPAGGVGLNAGAGQPVWLFAAAGRRAVCADRAAPVCAQGAQ